MSIDPALDLNITSFISSVALTHVLNRVSLDIITITFHIQGCYSICICLFHKNIGQCEYLDSHWTEQVWDSDLVVVCKH